MAEQLLVYGATGATGRRIVELAVAAGLRPVVGGRRLETLRPVAEEHGLEMRMADLVNVGRVLNDVRLVISCVPAYGRQGFPVAQAAAGAGAHYVDCSGEPAFVRRVIEELDGPARDHGAVLVPGAGLGVASNTVVAQASDDLGVIRRIRTIYRMSKIRPSAGTLRSGLELMAGPIVTFDGTHGEFIPAPRRMRRLAEGFALPFPSIDAVTMHRLYPAATIESFLLTASAPVVAPLAAGIGALCRSPRALQFLRGVTERAPGLRRDAVSGSIEVTATVEGDGGQRTSVTRVDNVYDFSALAAFSVAGRLLAGGTAPGVRVASEVVDTDVVGLQFTEPT